MLTWRVDMPVTSVQQWGCWHPCALNPGRFPMSGGAAVALADTQAIAWMLEIPPGTVRSWASRNHLKRRGTSADGRALYDVDEAGELARRMREQEAGRGCDHPQ